MTVVNANYYSAIYYVLFKKIGGRERDVIGSSVFLITILQRQYLVATSFKSHEICRISTSFVLLHIAFILLL